MWDFADQSHKPSLVLNFTASSITYFMFQNCPNADKKKQYMAFGDEADGTLFLYDVPPNLKTPQDIEKANIEAFWNREIEKCEYVKSRRALRKEEFLE